MKDQTRFASHMPAVFRTSISDVKKSCPEMMVPRLILFYTFSRGTSSSTMKSGGTTENRVVTLGLG